MYRGVPKDNQAMNTLLLASEPVNLYNKTKPNPPIMGLDNHKQQPKANTGNQYHVHEGDVISIFGEGERRRANFAREVTKDLKSDRVANIDLSKVNDPGFYLKLEQRKQRLAASECGERRQLEDRLRVALNANTWYDKPVQVLSLEERAKMLLILDLSERPDLVIINRPTLIRQFNRKLRALRQVFRQTFVMTDTIKNTSLAKTSDRAFELNRAQGATAFI